MSFTSNIAHTITPAAGNPVTSNNGYSAAMVTDIDEEISAGETTFSNIDVDVSHAELVILSCDADVEVTINDDGSPDATINLLAGKPLVWANDGYFANPLGETDVASVTVALASGTANFRMHVLQDPTP